MNWKTLSSKYLSHHPYFTAREDKCQKPDGNIVDPYFMVELPTSVCALSLTADNQAILVKQYRHPVGKVLLEIPGGFIDEGEDEKIAIARELLEETGYQFTQIDYLGRVAANPGVLNNYTALYLAQGGIKIKEQQLDDNEDIEIVLMPLNSLRKILDNNEIHQALHACCMFYAFNKLDTEQK